MLNQFGAGYTARSRFAAGPLIFLCVVFLGTATAAHAQLSATAYRVLGQIDFRHDGTNMVQGVELNTPEGVALDARNGQLHLYISDTNNSRIMAWQDVSSYQIGDPPTLVLGQSSPLNTIPLGIGVKGLNGPSGLAVDPTTGNLYVADTSDNRVLRFRNPFANPTVVEPDAVYGQGSFSGRTPGLNSSSLNVPEGVAFDSAGNLWVADTGNNRVLRFNATTLNNAIPPSADIVIGQKDFISGFADQGGSVSASGLDGPIALVFDSQDNLYVSDYKNTRVLKFTGPLKTSSVNVAASAVWGELTFNARGVPPQPTGSSLQGPVGLATDSNNLYVAVPADNRVMVFPLSATTGATAKSILGQSDPGTTTSNTGSAPLASPNSLAAPVDVKLAPNGDIFVADSGNNRVLKFPSGTKSATLVWGQTDFISNGANEIKPGSINAPFKMAIDYTAAPYALYVSDTANNRVLIWRDSVRFRNGDPADLAIGQPSLRTAAPNVDSPSSSKPTATSLFQPAGIALNPYDGTLYVADAGNNRVLRYPRPVSQSGRITPDAVIGQVDFTSSASALVSASSLNGPLGVAFGQNGDLFVADTGDNRVLEFPSGAGTGSSAIRVYGQPSFTSAVRPSQASAQTLSSPEGIAVDQGSNLYVADPGATRVVIYSNTQQNASQAGTPASFVLGPNFPSAGGNGAASSFKAPVDVAVDSNGNIYVSDSGNNRVLIFSSLLFLPSPPTGVVGQANTSGVNRNYDSPDGLATSDSLYGPLGIYIDRQDTLYVGDAGNNRVLQFLKSSAVVNAATFQANIPVAQGSLASLFGNAIAGSQATASAAPWPTTLVNRQLVINDALQAPIYFMGPGQVNFQVPSNAPLGTDRIAVRAADTGELIAGGSLVVAAASPGIFTSNQSGTGLAAALNQDLTVNGSNNPAPAGSTVVLYGTGQGPVSPAVPDGTAAPGSPGLAITVAIPTTNQSTCINNQPSMCVVFGTGALGNVIFSGLAPGYIGLWQINVTIPAGTPAGNVPVRVIINGSPSNVVSVAVK